MIQFSQYSPQGAEVEEVAAQNNEASLSHFDDFLKLWNESNRRARIPSNPATFSVFKEGI